MVMLLLAGQQASLLAALLVAGASALSYSPEEARVFASLSKAAYCGTKGSTTEELLNWTCAPCRDSGLQAIPGSVRILRHDEAGEANATFAYVARLAGGPPLGGACLLAVRGTSDLANWVGNMEVWKEPVHLDDCEGCRVEHGFLSIWKGLMPTLVRHLRSIGCGPLPTATEDTPSNSFGAGPKLWITGHSLGAAVATLAMLSLKNQGFQVEPAVVFHSPRLGNAAFARAFAQAFSGFRPFWRVTRDLDPVPLLPPRALGYRHVNYEVYYDTTGNFSVCARQEDPKCANRHSLPQNLMHTQDHCASDLVPSGRICGCQESGESPGLVMV
mmetsp:Transcript_20689/g.52834  ORF Transcript_20689/g.52834 Transcript_20689/m.52834 type:complete len:329 (+) Transcript_20689:73-1059(+)